MAFCSKRPLAPDALPEACLRRCTLLRCLNLLAVLLLPQQFFQRILVSILEFLRFEMTFVSTMCEREKDQHCQFEPIRRGSAMTIAALKQKPSPKTSHATMLVTRAEEWCVEAETAEEARALLAAGRVTVVISATACMPKSRLFSTSESKEAPAFAGASRDSPNVPAVGPNDA